MRALVITSLEPLRRDTEIWGTYWRFRLFLEAICQIATEVEILHLVGDYFLEENTDIDKISAEQSSYLQLPVSAHLIRCQRPRKQNLMNYYLRGVTSIYQNNEFFWYGGRQQVASVRAFLDPAPQLIFIHRLSAMIPILRCGRNAVPIFFDLDDVVHRVRLQAALRPPVTPGKLGQLCQVPAIALAERRGAALSRLTFVCSNVDRLRLKRLGFPRVAVVPNAIPMPGELPDLPADPTILFLASCDYPPNVAAAERLVSKVFPRIRAVIPEAQLLIAGKRTLELPSALRRPAGVHFLGYVEELAPLYGSARVVCCPITTGSGTRLKLIEAAAYARPVVATTFAAEGLHLRDGREILFRDDDEGMARACVSLIRDDAISRNIGMAARQQVQKNYDITAVRDRAVQLIYETYLNHADAEP